MYCIFDLHENGKDFDYYIAVENKTGATGEEFSKVTLQEGRYVRVEFMKRNHTAASLVAVYTMKFWIELNGYRQKKSPIFNLYDDRFHSNYQKHGCKDGNYLGDPVVVLYVPIQ